MSVSAADEYEKAGFVAYVVSGLAAAFAVMAAAGDHPCQRESYFGCVAGGNWGKAGVPLIARLDDLEEKDNLALHSLEEYRTQEKVYGREHQERGLGRDWEVSEGVDLLPYVSIGMPARHLAFTFTWSIHDITQR